MIITDKFSYFPILETLKTIFDNLQLTNIFKPRHIPKEGVHTEIRDANYLKENPLFSKENDALQIQLFYDDFETANPLGSKMGIYKVGAIYFTFRNMPPIFYFGLD